MDPLPRILIVFGLALAALGLLLHFGPPLSWIGRLPGDIRIERPGFRLYVPLATCLLASVAVTAVLWLISKIR